MSSMFDEIFSSGGVKDDPIKMLAALIAFEKANSDGVTALRASISVGIDNVSLKIGGRKDVVEALGIKEECEQFSKEIQPIATKYANAISEKYKAFVGKDPEEAAHKMAKWLATETKL